MSLILFIVLRNTEGRTYSPGEEGVRFGDDEVLLEFAGHDLQVSDVCCGLNESPFLMPNVVVLAQ